MSYYYRKYVIEETDTKRLADFMSSISKSELFVRECVEVSMSEILEANGINSYANDQLRGVLQFLEIYVDKTAEVERTYEKLKRKK